MPIHIEQLIKTALEDVEEIEYHNSYSGRSMYGAKCIAISGYGPHLQQVVAGSLKALVNEAFEQARDAESDLEYKQAERYLSDAHIAIDALLNYKTDRLGQGQILYWPDIQDNEEEEDDDDSDEDA